jgi:hypothetical protein
MATPTTVKPRDAYFACKSISHGISTEIQQHHLALIVGQRYLFAVQVLQPDLRRGLLLGIRAQRHFMVGRKTRGAISINGNADQRRNSENNDCNFFHRSLPTSGKFP